MERACKQCGNPIIGRDKRAVFCSYACKVDCYAAAGMAERTARLEGRRCVVCGGLIESRSGKAKCCSKACSVAYQNELRATRKRAEWLERRKPCAYCGGEIGDDRNAGSKYCSVVCKRNAMSARWRERSPGYMRQYLYGITPAEYDAMLTSQDHRCAICKTDTPGGKGGWHVDHCHASQRIRGLLCNNCNIMLGHADDDPARLRAAATYLES